MALRRKLSLYVAAGVTASFTGGAVDLGAHRNARDFMGRLKAVNNSGTTPTLDISIQTSVDNGVTWKDFLVFTQVTNVMVTGSDPEDVHNNPDVQHAGTQFRAKGVLAGTLPNYDITEVTLWYDPTYP